MKKLKTSHLILAGGDLFEKHYKSSSKFFSTLINLNSYPQSFSSTTLISNTKVGIKKSYFRNIKFISNKNLAQMGNLGTLAYAINKINNEFDYLLVTYVDRYFSEDTISELVRKSYKTKGVTVLSKKTINKDSNENFEYKNESFEFGGAIVIHKNILNKYKYFFQKNSDKNLTYLLNWDSPLLNEIFISLPKDDWNEISDQLTATKLIMKSKADTLIHLSSKTKYSRIPYLEKVTSNDFNKNWENILKRFSSNIIVRSNSMNEDGFLTSSAGHYYSSKQIPKSDIKLVKENINRVIKSYGKDKNANFIIQNFVKDIEYHGVVTTHSLESSAPYIIFNLSSSQDTASITAGKEKNIQKIVVFNKVNNLSGNLKKYNILIKFIKEIQELLNYEYLDIEFIKRKKENFVNLTQARPLILKEANSDQYHDNITKGMRRFQQLQNKKQGIYGDYTIFSNMTDWNPIEMLGETPSTLATSIYKFMITNSTWAKQRNEFGYKKNTVDELLHTFNGKNYIDIRLSLNSFLVDGLSNMSYNNLINFQLDKIKSNPGLHDKVEFEVGLTNFNFDLDQKLKLYREIISKKDYLKIQENLYLIDKNNENILIRNQKIVNRYFKHLKASNGFENLNIFDIKNKLALPFAHHARLGFVYKDQLDSLLRLSVIDSDDYNKLLQSLDTISNNFSRDLFLLKKGKFSKKKFLYQYGSQRPDTYNIKSSNLTSIDSAVFDNMVDSAQYENLIQDTTSSLEKIEDYFKKISFHQDAKLWYKNFKASIEAREFTKFKYSFALNLVLENIKNKNKEVDLENLSNVPILKYVSNGYMYKSQFELSESFHLELPDVISNSTDFLYFKSLNNKPNFIGSEIVEGEVVYLQDLNSNINIKNKIVLIDYADPGWDWIFSFNFEGLITKYGGPNSHMAIRCSEKNKTASFGVGESIFSQLLNSKIVEINPKKRNMIY